MNDVDKRWLSVSEAAAYLGCSRNMLDKDRLEGESTMHIPFTRLGRLIRYDRHDLDKYLETLKTTGASINGNDR